MKQLAAVLILAVCLSSCAKRVAVTVPELSAQDRIVAVLNSNLESHEKVAIVRDILGWATAVIAVAK